VRVNNFSKITKLSKRKETNQQEVAAF